MHQQLRGMDAPGLAKSSSRSGQRSGVRGWTSSVIDGECSGWCGGAAVQQSRGQPGGDTETLTFAPPAGVWTETSAFAPLDGSAEADAVTLAGPTSTWLPAPTAGPVPCALPGVACWRRAFGRLERDEPRACR